MIIVFGSINIDMMFEVASLPQRGETVISDTYDSKYGGKGANQALAASRSGAKVALVACSGSEATTTRMLRFLRRDGVMTTGIGTQDDVPTGCAVVTVDSKGANQIVLSAGANAHVSAEQVPDEILRAGNVVLAQMEVPDSETRDVMQRAHQQGATTILNYAPAQKPPGDMFKSIDYLLVNELEAAQLLSHAGIEPIDDAQGKALKLAQHYNLICVITCGAKGAVAADSESSLPPVKAIEIEDVVDTTGAGDAFCGMFAACIHAGLSLEDAMRWGCAAGSLSCMKKGAQDSYPYLSDIQDALDEGASPF